MLTAQPWPGALSIVANPPVFLAKSRDACKPKPRPAPGPLVVKNGSIALPSTSAAMPTPSSAIAKQT